MKRTLSFALVFLLVTSTCCWARSKTDVITLHNDDRVTCTINSLYAGILECSTDAMGTLNIEWDEIADIRSNYEFHVRYSDGSRSTGRIDTAGDLGEFTVRGKDGVIEEEWLQVVEIRPLEKTRKDALDVYLSAGFDYTKASDTTQLTLGLDIGYEKELSHSAMKLRHVVSDTREESTSSTKLDLFRGISNNRTKRLFRYGSSSYESNDQLALDYRVSLGGGFGSYFIDNHERQLISALGLQVNTESDLAGKQQESVEGALALQFATWNFDSPELDVKVTLNLYPSLTNSGRLRGDSDLRLRWELYKDLYWDISAWSVYDNENTSDGDFDYGLTTGIGWDY